MSKKQIIKILQPMLAMILYFILLLFLDNGEHIISNLILVISFYMIIKYLLNSKENIFSIDKLFVYLFFIIGIFFRMIVIKIYREDFQSFANIKLENNEIYFINTAILIFISILFYIIGKKISENKKVKKTLTINKIKLQEDVLIFFYIIVLLIVITYKVKHINYAVFEMFGIFDNIFNILSDLLLFISIFFLIKFIKTKLKKYMLLYLIYTIPIIFLSLLSGWKGIIIGIIITVLITLSAMKIKYNKKIGILIILCIFITVFPIISMYRVNISLNENVYKININSIINYLIENNPLRYLSNRLGYYDTIYLSSNIDEKTKNLYRNTSGLIHENVLIGFIPRVLYGNKKVMGAGRYNATIIAKIPEKIYTNVSISYIGELFINYSYWGVAIFNLLLGFAVGYLTKIKDNNADIISILKYIFFGNIIIGFTSGSLAMKIVGLLTMIILINLLCFTFKINEK